MSKIIPEVVVYYMLTFVGFEPSEAHKMTCVAKYESSLRYNAINLHNQNASIDVGLFQINTVWFNTIEYCRLDNLQNPISNIKCAKYVHNIQGITAWYGYLKHKDTCDNYKVKGVQ